MVGSAGGPTRQVTTGDFHHGRVPGWTPDGGSLIFSTNRHPDWQEEILNSELYELSLADGKIRALTDRSGPDHSGAVSPDGRHVAWVGYDDEGFNYQINRLYVMDLDGSRRKILTRTLDRSVQQPVWAPDGQSLYFQYDDQGDTKIARVDMKGNLTVQVHRVGGTEIGRPYTSGKEGDLFAVASNGNVVYLQVTPYRPADLVLRERSGGIRLLTRLNQDLLGRRELGNVETFWFKSSYDGKPIQGWLVTPPGFDPKNKYPLLLEIHGGSSINYGARFSVEVQLYAAAGYVVLYVNPRGTGSYGEAFAQLAHHAYPGHDYDDLMSGVDAVVRRGFVDDRQLFVTGGSGGGLLASWI